MQTTDNGPNDALVEELALRDSNWRMRLTGREGKEFENVELFIEGDILYYGTFVEVVSPEKTIRTLILFERDQGKDKVGDVIAVYRKHPTTKRWMLDVDQEIVHVSPTEMIKIWRLKRSSIDNVEKAVKRSANHSGWTYANARRIGGKPIKVHYLVAGWPTPEQEENMQFMDVFDFVNSSQDSLGHTAILKSLPLLPTKVRNEIFAQICQPAA